MALSKETLERIERDVEWAKPVDGVINVPDWIDPLINKIGFQYNLHSISNVISEPEMVCRIAAQSQKFFALHYEPIIAELREALGSVLLFIENDGKPVDGFKFRENAMSAKQTLLKTKHNDKEIQITQRLFA